MFLTVPRGLKSRLQAARAATYKGVSPSPQTTANEWRRGAGPAAADDRRHCWYDSRETEAFFLHRIVSGFQNNILNCAARRYEWPVRVIGVFMDDPRTDYRRIMSALTH